MTRKDLSLAAPFIVLGVVVASFALTPPWIQRQAKRRREPALAALGHSLQMANRMNLLWLLMATGGGVGAAILVQRHQRLAADVQRMEQERSHELEQFSARVAHDIVSPLAPVSLGVQVLARKLEGDSQAQQAVQSIRRSLDRVSMIVDELLRFAKAGARPAPDEAADLRGVIEAVRDELVPVAEQNGIVLTFETPPPVKVACAEGALLVVLQNLVVNAIKYIGGGPQKRIAAKATLVANHVRLTVQDSGPGIPPGMERSVFEPYFRAAGGEEPGIGLGLATAKRIVEARSGRIGVWSEARKGTTFWVDLPIAS